MTQKQSPNHKSNNSKRALKGSASASRTPETVQPKPASTAGKSDRLMILASVQSAADAIKSLMKMISGELITRSPSELVADLSGFRKMVAAAILEPKKPTEQQADIAMSYFASSNLLPGYCSLDASHIQDINEVSNRIRQYASDPSRKRPLNILMLATPGAGKSHFIKCLSKGLSDTSIAPVTYNMTAMERGDDLIRPLDECRNLKVEDKLPLLFLDEFDSNPDNYAKLLPLLWDSEIHLGHRDLKLGKIVIIMAGSNPELPTIMEAAQSMQITPASSNLIGQENSKIVDLLSRINGGTLQIPELDLFDECRDRRIDKVCIALGLLVARFGKQLCLVPRSFLRFIALSKFKYGVRSIAHLIDIIPTSKKPLKSLSRTQLGLPLGSASALRRSSLAYHLVDAEQAHGVVARWQECSATDADIKFNVESAVAQQLADRRAAAEKTKLSTASQKQPIAHNSKKVLRLPNQKR